MPTYEITRDGEHVATTESPLGWFHRNTSQSMDHALRHEGYAVTETPDDVDTETTYAIKVETRGADETTATKWTSISPGQHAKITAILSEEN